MPPPLSWMLSNTLPCCSVSFTSISGRVPSGTDCSAFNTRLVKRRLRCVLSACTHIFSGSNFQRIVISSLLLCSCLIESKASFISINSLLAFSIFANWLNSLAMLLRWSICSTIVLATVAVSAFTLGALFSIALCKNCMLNFMGVSGFFISCATCLAISRQALSRSVLARAAALSSNFASILLYSFTRLPISSFLFHCMASLILPRFICCIFSLIKAKEPVILLVMNRATIPAIKKINAFRLMMVTKKLAISCCSLLSEVK